MQLEEAKETATQILNEERVRPTIGYRDDYSDLSERVGQDRATAFFEALRRFTRTNLTTLRAENPRIVSEFPETYAFGGTNYDLLLAVFRHLAEDQRAEFVDYLCGYVRRGGFTGSDSGISHHPNFSLRISDLPLIAEFCIRTGYLSALLIATQQVRAPTVAVALMMMELEDLVALNFNVLTQQELKTLYESLKPLREVADAQTHSARGTVGKTVPNPRYKSGREKEANRIVRSIDGLAAQCQQANYFYLKGVLLKEKPNLETEGDRAKVITFLDSLGFNPMLKQGLEQAEKEYRDATNVFELKNCLGHLRSFLEYLHRESAKAIAKAAGETVNDRWGDATNYLCVKSIFTRQHEEFVTSLFTLISDTSVHPLGADREYARLLRNVVIEYGVMFLSTLSRNGIKIA